MVYAFARVSAVVNLKVEDYFPLKERWWLRLHEKGGKVNEMGCHHKLKQFLDKKGRCSALPSAGRKSSPLPPCRASMRGTWCYGDICQRLAGQEERFEAVLVLFDNEIEGESMTTLEAKANIGKPVVNTATYLVKDDFDNVADTVPKGSTWTLEEVEAPHFVVVSRVLPFGITRTTKEKMGMFLPLSRAREL